MTRERPWYWLARTKATVGGYAVLGDYLAVTRVHFRECDPPLFLGVLGLRAVLISRYESPAG